MNGPVADPQFKWSPKPVTGNAGRYDYVHPNDNYEQPRQLYKKVFTETDREHLIATICGGLGQCRQDIKERMVKHFYKIDPDYGTRVAKGVGVSIEKAKL